MVHDVVVVGATVAGLTAARRLAAEGFDVVVLDPNPEGVSVAVGHGMAACAHSSTVATMSAAYGPEAAREHVDRNLAGLQEIRRVIDAGGVPHAMIPLHDHSLGVALDRELHRVVELLESAGAGARILQPHERRLATAGLVSEAIVLDPASYGSALARQAAGAGADIRHDLTVTHLQRRDGATVVTSRPNLAWAREAYSMLAVAVIDTLGVSPWGQLAGIGPAQFVPRVRFVADEVPDVVTLTAGPPVWLIRPDGDEVVAYGPKCTSATIAGATAELERWVWAQGGRDLRSGRLVIDPSDHGRPVAGASAIPGGYYARGNGRGELMNGTASGTYLAALMLGLERAHHRNALPMSSRLRARARGLSRRVGL
ncbi:FAD-binding oxidoreductase [Tessaracoccus sp. OS52]|uniref:FAD-dependent oxidoreductase n=1 Tax=Tessaracoccus sp. OS52 TaxID=2886691 RepID=UPI001D11DFEB|nr:FAD-dependent oxidoreductase [Tessaracoccus sp. OS52]MCC2593630.1 FAD-binding oxidoreductase [Tessaracoccus sp. OS52]